MTLTILLVGQVLAIMVNAAYLGVKGRGEELAGGRGTAFCVVLASAGWAAIWPAPPANESHLSCIVAR